MSHSKYSPSKLGRYLACPGSKVYADEVSATNQYAEEGTRLHTIIAECIKAEALIPEVAKELPEIQEALELCLSEYKRVKEQYFSGICQIYIEHTCITPHPDIYGTADVVLYNSDCLAVIDWKFGKGVKVTDMTQLKAYAYGALQTPAIRASINITKIKNFPLVICQPLLYVGINIQEEVVTLSDLNAWWDAVILKLTKWNYEPGETCKWCPGITTCRAAFNAAQVIAVEVFKQAEALQETPVSIPVTDLISLWEKRAFIEAYFSKLEDELKSLAVANKVPGYKVVAGRSNRQWTDYDKAASFLESHLGFDNSFSHKLLSPAQAEKKLPKEAKAKMLELVTKAPGKPTLVSESDARAPLAVSVFNNLED